MDEGTRNALLALEIVSDTVTAVHGQNVVAREGVLDRLQRDKERQEDKDYDERIRKEDRAWQEKKYKDELDRFQLQWDYNVERDILEDTRYETTEDERVAR